MCGVMLCVCGTCLVRWEGGGGSYLTQVTRYQNLSHAITNVGWQGELGQIVVEYDVTNSQLYLNKN